MAVDGAFRSINAAVDDATECDVKDVKASYHDAAASLDFGATIDKPAVHLCIARILGLPNEGDVAASAAAVAIAAEPSHYVAIDHSYFTANDDSTYYFNY